MKSGGRITILFITINLFIAALLAAILVGGVGKLLQVLIEWPLNFGPGIAAMYALGFYIGNWMETLIQQKKWNGVLTGMMGAMLILFIGTFVGAMVGFFLEGVPYWQRTQDLGSAMEDYLLKPLYWIFAFGTIPTIIAGSILGVRLKKNVPA